MQTGKFTSDLHSRWPSRRAHLARGCVFATFFGAAGIRRLQVPHLFMDRQIFHAEVTNITNARRETLLVDVRPNPKDRQRKALVLLTLDTDDEHLPGRTTVGTLCPANAQALAELLWDAADVAALLDEEPRAGIIGVRKLPTISLCGTEFIIDDRMRQLRNVKNPAHFFDLKDRA